MNLKSRINPNLDKDYKVANRRYLYIVMHFSIMLYLTLYKGHK